MLELNPDGTWDDSPRPTFAELVRHAERFGVECVAETAAEFMGVESLTALIVALDRIAGVEDAKREYSRLPRRRVSAEDRAKKLLGIEDEDE